jgi:tetratricopeptide (TPR) repeat protein
MTNIHKNNPLESSCEYIKKSFELKNLKLYKEAIEMLYKALSCEDNDVPNVEIISQIGDLYMLLKNYERAIEEYEKVLEIEPLHHHTLFQLCEIYFLQKRYSEALDLIKEVCENSKETKNFIKYFEILYQLEKFDEIAQIYETLDLKSQNNEEILYIMSLSSKDKKREFLNKIIEHNNEHLEAHFDLGVLDFRENKLNFAKTHFEFVVKSQKNAAAQDYLGLIYQKEGQFSKAIKHFYEACKIDKTKGEYYFNLAKAYIDVFWFDEAQVAIQKYLKLAQFENSEIDLSEHYYTLAWINWQRKNLKNALLNIGLIEKIQCFLKMQKF